MKGKGIQVTNKAYRDGWERTFRKDSEIPSLLDSMRHISTYSKEELRAGFIEMTEVCVEDVDAIVDSSGYCSVHESYHCECYRPEPKLTRIDPYAQTGTETPRIPYPKFMEKMREVKGPPTPKSPLMESWILDINHFEGLD